MDNQPSAINTISRSKRHPHQFYRHARGASGPAEDSTDIFCGRHDPNELKEVVFYEDGEPIIDGEPGDLRFRIHTAPHECFRREGNDLHTTVTITLVQALVSYEKTIKHLDEHLVDISTKLST